jgi:hypothetical protein
VTDKTDTLTMELDKRLEDLFDEDTLMEPEKSSSPPKPVRKETSKKNPDLRFAGGEKPGGDPLRGLNALLLSMEWEIDDSVMDQYLGEIQRLQGTWEKDRIVLNFFRILEALGSYLKQKKVHAHQDTLRLLQEIQGELGMLMDKGETLQDLQRKEHFQKAYQHFQDFRKQITGKTGDLSSTAKAKEEQLSGLIRGIVREELEKFRQRLLQDLRS